MHNETLTLSAVTVAYPGRQKPALDRVSLSISPGERIAVTGPSGAGKSTLLGLLLGFVEPTAGRIRVGPGSHQGSAPDMGTDWADIDGDWWRRQIAWVPQRPHLFAGTISGNIALGEPDAPPEEVARAARLAGASEFIEALPAGYATMLGDRATTLSAGQRQRIALARAFLRDAPLLLLDEPAAHLDPLTGEQILRAVQTLMAGRTVVLVTHGQAWAGGADRVVRLEDGRLVPAVSPVPGPGAATPAAVP
jgi:ABC-type multidrug transport system fused ATPase/permease subunit